MNAYEAYKAGRLDLSPFGLTPAGNECTYFCTPVGADIFAAVGVDGIHYCTVKGCGDTIFAVSPASCVGEQVNAVARSFDDFIRLLLMLDDNAAIEQCHQWTAEQFDDFVSHLSISSETKAAAEEIISVYGLEPMENPYEYITGLQSQLDLSRLEFGEEYYELLPDEPKAPPEWKVYFGEGFYESGRSVCRELKVEKHFSWGDEEWYIPSVYVCSKGIVADIFAKVDAAKVEAHLKKYNDLYEDGCVSDELEEQESLENPLNFCFSCSVSVNGIPLREKNGHGCSWLPSYDDIGTKWVLDHYGLDKDCAWIIRRVSFASTGRMPKVKSIEWCFQAAPKLMFTEPFVLAEAGESVTVSHPVTDTKYTITAVEVADEQLDMSVIDDGFEHPTHAVSLTYSTLPDTGKQMLLRDCEPNDAPRPCTVQTDAYKAAIAIIGGVDGPTAVITSSAHRTDGLHTVCSSLHFEKPDVVKWKAGFKVRTREDIRVTHTFASA